MNKKNTHTNYDKPDDVSLNAASNAEILKPGISPKLNTEKTGSHGNNTHNQTTPSKSFLRLLADVNWLMALATIVIAVATVLYTSTAMKQLDVMANTLREMQDNGKTSTDQTEKIITEANRIAGSMSETAHQSKVALDATIENFHLEQRAWVGPTIVSYPRHTVNGNKVYVKEGEKFTADISVINSGKTPARDVRTVTTVFFEKPRTILKQQVPKNVKDLQGVGILQPGARLEISTVFPRNGAVISKNDIEEITSGRAIISIVGEINYSDVFKESHFAKFCFQLRHDLTGFHGCKKGNDAN